MPPHIAASFGNRIEGVWNSMPYWPFNNIFNYGNSKQQPDHRISEIEVVFVIADKAPGKQFLDKVNGVFNYDCNDPRNQAGDYT